MELIVVLVILAILAALLVPALTGYIDRAKEKKVTAEAKGIWTAAQAAASEYYGLHINDTAMQKSMTNFMMKTAEFLRLTLGKRAIW